LPESERSIESVQRFLRVTPSQSTKISSAGIQDHFSVTRINGSALLSVKEDQKINTLFDPKRIHFGDVAKQLKNKVWLIDSEVWDTLTKYEKQFNDEIAKGSFGEKTYCNLTYAWENNDHLQFALDRISDFADSVRKIIVIGYSFPYVNRQIDRRIIGMMSNLSEIVIQDPGMSEDRFNQVKNQLLSFIPRREYTVRRIPDCTEFLLPKD
jgi:hypothetical protein